MKRDCGNCRYWSEMIAMSDGRFLKAMCLSSTGPLREIYTTVSQVCSDWASGHDGAIDDPRKDPRRYDEVKS